MGRPAKKKADANKPSLAEHLAKARAARTRQPKCAFSTKAGTGRSLHAKLTDGPSIWARRQAEVFNNIVSDLGGRSEQSELSMQMIRRAIGLTVLCEQMEIALAENQKVDLGEYVLAINAFSRVSNALGLSRKPKDITPSLHEYLTMKAAERAAEEAETAEDGNG
jgi:hypothetical protein